MTRLFTLLFLIFSLTSYSQKSAMNHSINLVLNTKKKIDDALYITLTRFSHKNPIDNKQASVSTAHLTLLQENKEDDLIISMYHIENKQLNNKQYESVNWNNYTILLKKLSYDESIDIVITKTEDLKKTRALEKNKLIQQANKLIASKYSEFIFDPKLYEITTWANSKKTIVKYRRIIRFTPLNKKGENLKYDFDINLIDKRISPFDFWTFDRFYIPTTKDQEKINFVIEAFGLPRFGFNNTILEEHDMYSIYIDNEVAFGQYFIDKITGKECMGSIEGSYAPMPDFPELINPDPLIEIK